MKKKKNPPTYRPIGEMEGRVRETNIFLRVALDCIFVLYFRFTQIHANQLLNHDGGGSGGYLEHVLKYAAHNLFGHDVTQIEYKVLR